MAANTTGRVLAGVFRKRLANHSSTSGDSHHHSHAPAASSLPYMMLGSPPRRNGHTSWYDKDVEEEVCPTVVPDHVIQSGSDGNCYWVPHPRTGVFGPASGEHGGSSPPPAGNGSTSVLDEPVWFRYSMEDVDKDAYL